MLVPGMSHPPSTKNHVGFGGSMVKVSDSSGSTEALVSAGAACANAALASSDPHRAAANILKLVFDMLADPPDPCGVRDKV
ncbi:MAG: hypothetical protein V4523_00860 [Pseudomonadota bacterium]